MRQLDYLLPGGVRQGSAADERTAQLVHPAVTWGHVSQVRGDAGVKSGGHRQGAGGMPLRLLDWLLGTRQARFVDLAIRSPYQLCDLLSRPSSQE